MIETVVIIFVQKKVENKLYALKFKDQTIFLYFFKTGFQSGFFRKIFQFSNRQAGQPKVGHIQITQSSTEEIPRTNAQKTKENISFLDNTYLSRIFSGHMQISRAGKRVIFVTKQCHNIYFIYHIFYARPILTPKTVAGTKKAE